MECFAPDKAQFHVIDHTAGSPMDQTRKWVGNDNCVVMVCEYLKTVVLILELKLDKFPFVGCIGLDFQYKKLYIKSLRLIDITIYL